MSARTLGAINKLTDLDQIQVNQRIWVPRRRFSLLGRWRSQGVFVRVKSGDTIAELARNYESDSGLILAYNRVRDPTRLQPGVLLFIPWVARREPSRIHKPRPPEKRVEVAEPGRLDAGILAWPIRAKFRLTSRFGERNSTPHKGIDLAAPRGTPIYAADDGVVIVASQNLRGYGKTVVILHQKGLRTVYAHADKICVKLGQKIERGQKIAEVGCTGRSTGFHLHFEVRQGTDKAVDPLKYLSKLD